MTGSSHLEEFKQRKIFKKYVLPEGADLSITEAIANKKNGLDYVKSNTVLHQNLLDDVDFSDLLGTKDALFEENK